MLNANFAPQNKDEQRPSSRKLRQIPIDTGNLTELEITAVNNNPFIRVVVTNDLTFGDFRQNTEYWFTGAAVSISGVSEIQLTSQSVPYGGAASMEQDVVDFVGDFSLAFAWTQNIGTSGWAQGTFLPEAPQARLYKAVDPDDSSRMMGVLIEQAANNQLVGITWYKKSNTGTIFATTPASLTLELVTNAEGRPSTDPNDIDQGPWYYARGAK